MISGDPDDFQEEDPESVKYLDINRDFNAYFTHPYLKQFSAIVERGGEGDIIEFEVDDNPALEYFARNGITHFGHYTCDYETGYVENDDNEAIFARGKIVVSISANGEVEVSGEAECDDASYDEGSWDWFGRMEAQIEDWVDNDELGLISWQLMAHINAQLEAEIEDLRARSGPDEEDESEAQDEEDEDEDEVEESEDNRYQQETDSGDSEDEDEA
ncbi:unnamed protein product [Aureobasidium mustum]|uniref:Uncharacterized protein n=1 Tax=Aureobasidium mustum TaxID=2773714 RepID=A0A9N8K8T7_9PEZI|nr:unnamed protein product [Aureobasidium mustum]